MENYFGIDIGGTNAKFGIVSRDGTLIEKTKYPTPSLTANGTFVEGFSHCLREQIAKYPDIRKVGIGIPGLISKDRTTALKVQNIPPLNGINLLEALTQEFPGYTFKMDNDANVAALGEYYFATEKLPESFLMITLGTGVGGAAIFDGKIFAGVDGNGLEIGHILAGNGGTVEESIGKKGIVAYTHKILNKNEKPSILRDEVLIDAKRVVKAAKKGDRVGLKVFKKVGQILGQCIVSSIRILDVKTIVIGGGVADTFPIIEESMLREIHEYLPGYYTDDLQIKTATLANEAGIIGAASLNF